MTHDLASGVMTDGVYEDTVRNYEFSKRLADDLIDTRLDLILARVDTRGEGVPVAVFNSVGWPRTDLAEADVGFARGGVRDFDVVDHTGTVIPSQLLGSERYRDGGLKRIQCAFLARGVPALGYSIYHVVPRTTTGAPKSSLSDTNS